jgi:thiol:disulfide interchange protein DsbD
MKRLLLALLLVLFALPAAALESAPVTSSRVTATLVSDTDAVAPGQPLRVGLRLRMANGWHTYWKNPGDAGVPSDLALTLPAGATAGPIAWPTPRRIAEGSLMTYAYTGEVLLPVTITPSSTAQPLSVTAHASWLVCKDICVPEEGDFHLTLPIGTPAPSAQAPLFAEHDRMMPRPSPWTVTVAPDGALWVRGPELNNHTVTDAWFVPDEAGRIQDIAPQLLSVRDGGFVLSLKPQKPHALDAGLSGVLSVLDRSGMQTNVAVSAVPGIAPDPAGPPLPQVLVFAFLGGLILNLMPCVFPILAMKAVAFAAGAARGKAQSHALSYTLGVLVTFVGLAATLLVARAAGAAAGWGAFQFSSPLFVAAMAWLLFGVGLNLSGVFQIGTPLASVGGRLTDRNGHVGSFFTGLLAVLVATPCTAPFMGVAVAAGLAAPPPITLLVFAVMGLGLAAPYVALSCMPGLGRRIPRPGRWMELLKQALAFPMYGAAVWLLWVVSQEAGPAGVLATAAGFVLLGFAAWVLGVSQAAADRSRRVGRAAAVVCGLAALYVLSNISGTEASAPDANAATEAFSPARLAALRAEGRPVFVDMTAAWCVTCLVNERVAIDTTSVQQEFAAHHVAYLKGDWTRQAPDITAYLRENGRDGVPLYVYYPPNGGTPRVLPQVLTEDTVLSELDRG